MMWESEEVTESLPNESVLTVNSYKTGITFIFSNILKI